MNSWILGWNKQLWFENPIISGSFTREKQSIIAFCIKQDSWELILEEFIFINVSEASTGLDESQMLSWLEMKAAVAMFD